MPEPRYFSIPSTEVGLGRPQELGPELLAVRAVIHPLACRGDPLTGRNRGGVPDDGHQFAMAARLDAQDTEAVLSIPVGEALYQPRQRFSIGWMGLRPHDVRRPDAQLFDRVADAA